MSVAQSCLTLCDPMDHSPPGSFVHGILQARILEWTDMPSSREPSQPRDQTCVSYVSCIGMRSKSFQSCPTLCDPLDCGPSGSSNYGILQARILKWVAMPFSRGSSQSRDQTYIYYVYLPWQVGSLPLVPPGKPQARHLGRYTGSQDMLLAYK